MGVSRKAVLVLEGREEKASGLYHKSPGFTNSFIHSSSKYLLSTYDIPGGLSMNQSLYPLKKEIVKVGRDIIKEIKV